MPVPCILDDPAKRQHVLSVLAVGGSLNDAAAFLKIEKSTLWRYRQANPDFELEIRHAEAAGKLKHLKRLNDASDGWRASLVFLERKYPMEWGRRDRIDVRHDGTVEVDAKVKLQTEDLSDDDILRLTELVARLTRGEGSTV